MPNAATLPLLLKKLGLPVMLEKWEQIEQQAQEKQWPYPDYLAMLAEHEVAHRYEKRIERRTKEAHLPSGKTLSCFDFSKAPSINPLQIKALADNTAWCQRG